MRQAASLSAEPQSVMRPRNRVDNILREARANYLAIFSAGQPLQAAFVWCKPNAFVLIHIDRSPAFCLQAANRVCDESAVAKSINPSRSSHPDIAFAILKKRRDLTVCVRVLSIKQNSVGVYANQSAGCADPDIQIAVTNHGTHWQVSQRRRNPLGGDFGAIPSQHTAIRADPQFAVGKYQQAVDRCCRSCLPG